MLDFANYTVNVGAMIVPGQYKAGTKDPKVQSVQPAAYLLPGFNYQLPRQTTAITRMLGPEIYQEMLTDATVWSAYASTKLSILDGDLRLIPVVKQHPSPRRPTKAIAAKPEASGDVDPDPEQTDDLQGRTPEEKLGADVHDYCERAVKRISFHLSEAMFMYMDCMAYGVKLIEPTFAVCDAGPDAGRLVPDRVQVKPNRVWSFVVDDMLVPQKILACHPIGYIVHPIEKFSWLSWMPKDSDPRGTSILEAAHTAWNLKIQAWPGLYAMLEQFGSPGLDMELAPNDTTDRLPLDAYGNPDPTKPPVPPAVYYSQVLAFYRRGRTVVRPNASKLNVIEPRTAGEAFHIAMRLYAEEICLAIQLQARTTLEAKNGSKADSESAGDTKGPLIGYGRNLAVRPIYEILHKGVMLNWGKAIADQYTSVPTLGNAEHQDKPALWNAAANLMRSGYFGPSQMPAMDEAIGVDIRDQEADDAKAAEAMATMQASVKPVDSSGGKGKEKGKGKGDSGDSSAEGDNA